MSNSLVKPQVAALPILVSSRPGDGKLTCHVCADPLVTSVVVIETTRVCTSCLRDIQTRLSVYHPRELVDISSVTSPATNITSHWDY